MKILITGICGFVGSTLAKALKEHFADCQIIGIDNLSRSGSWLNKVSLQELGITIIHGDIRQGSDVDALPAVDWVIDAAANPSVLAGVDGKTSSLQLVQHNLLGTINLLEYCKRHQVGFILLSTSRVYSIPGLSHLQVAQKDGAFYPLPDQAFPSGISPLGVSESYSTAPPVSLYGSTKVASEHLALEYGATFDFPVWINRCGVLAGAGQFGKPDQGIFAFWLHSWREQRLLKYIGFDGMGHQVRDCLHPRDLAPLLMQQMAAGIDRTKPAIVNVSGGLESAMSLRQLSEWCGDRWGVREVISDRVSRKFDLPWVVIDNTLVRKVWAWQPILCVNSILEEIAVFADIHKNWILITQ